MENIRQQIINLVKQSQNILLMPSAPADGDSIGSALALYLAFKKLDKNVTVVMAEPVPDAFEFLPTTNVISHEFNPGRDFIVTLDCEKAKLNTIKTKIEENKVNIIITAKKGEFSNDEVSFHHGPSKYDLIITVDTGDLSQLGRFYEDNTELFTQIPVINIDHHASNGHFGRINYVDIMSSATTEMLVKFIEDLEKATDSKLMDEDIATLLLAGIITDTGSFQNANTTPRSFSASAQLIRYGARQQEIIQHVFKTKRLSTLRLWGRILSNIKLDQKHRFVWSTISRKDFADTQSREDETGGIIDELMTNAPGTEVVLILKHRFDGFISGSVRTTSQAIDSSKIAGLFGGGGHVQAAGFKIKSDNFEEVERMVVEKVKAFQKQRLNLTDDTEEATPVVPDRVMEQQLKQAVQEHLNQVEKLEPAKESTQSVAEESTPSPTEPTVNTEDTDSVRTRDRLQEGESFADVIVRKANSSVDEPFEIQNGVTYKFEE